MTRPYDTVSPDEAYANISENVFQEHVNGAARERGYELYHVIGKKDHARVTSFGFPDCVIGKDGKGFEGFVELGVLQGVRLYDWAYISRRLQSPVGRRTSLDTCHRLNFQD